MRKRITSGISLGLSGGIQFNINARNQRKYISGRAHGGTKMAMLRARFGVSFTLCIRINMQCQLNLRQETISLKTYYGLFTLWTVRFCTSSFPFGFPIVTRPGLKTPLSLALRHARAIGWITLIMISKR